LHSRILAQAEYPFIDRLLYCRMFKKSFVIVMLLVASLIGIGSAANYQPEVTIAQPQPQTPQQQQPQLQSPAPSTLGKRLTGPQGQQQQQSNTGTLVQIQQDRELVNRLFPYIIEKIDGNTLIQKIGPKRLAEIMLQHTQLKYGTEPRESAIVDVKKSGPAPPASYHQAIATCPPGSKITGGGVVIMAYGQKGQGLFAGPADNQIVESRYGNLGNTWLGVVRMESSGSFYTQAVCAWPSLRVLQ
jgi:hypothetical protein